MARTAAAPAPQSSARFSTLTDSEKEHLIELTLSLSGWADGHSEFADVSPEIGAILKALGWQPTTRATLFV